MNYIRNLYDWVLSWANKPNGVRALGSISFAEASFFPIPPDILLIPLALGNKRKAIYFGIVCTFYSILGGVLGYSIGLWLWWSTSGELSAFANYFFENVPGLSVESFYNVKLLYEKYNFFIIFTAGFTPIPFKLFTISAGAFSVEFTLFLLASIVGRGSRFMILSFLIKKFGESIKYFIDKYFNILAIVFTILLFGGMYIIKFLI
tara:strand:+ start:2310 stop:2924 length:615 start_codon:yes stop_codon:yes gene_type:complete